MLIKKFRIKSFKEQKPVIQLKDLTISYGNRMIVENLNLSIQKSEICGLLGPNGAGKSTIYHSIIGLVKPTYGKIIINELAAYNFLKRLDYIIIYSKMKNVNYILCANNS